MEKPNQKSVEVIEKADGEGVQNLTYILFLGNGKEVEIISYNQLVDHLEAAANEDGEISDDLHKFRALIDHQGPSRQQVPIGKGVNTMSLLIGRLGRSPMNLSVLAADDPVTCATYYKENDLLHIDGWKRFRNLAKRVKS